ncbi:MAG: hypothetical protein ACQESX_08835 [Bacteroidota bacterium]
MKTIHQLLNKIFPQKSTVEQGKTAFSGRLERAESYKKDYETWKSSGRIKEILSILRKELEDSLKSGEPTNILGVHEGKGFTGIYMKNDDLLESREYPFLLDYFHEKIKELNYQPYHSIEDQKPQNGYITSKQMHYLKPKLSSFEPPYNQEYGNITLELELMDDKPRFLKAFTTHYNGFDYAKPKPANELFRILVAA